MGIADYYSDLVAEAEKMVRNIKDPLLKQVAFQKVLEQLLMRPPKRKAPTAEKSRASPSPRAGAARR